MQKLPDILNVSESALNCRSYLWPIILAIVARIYLLGSPTLEIDLNIWLYTQMPESSIRL